MSLQLESQFVKKGLWTNLERGPVLGKTITTDSQTGSLVVAVLAIMSTLGTAHLWHILSFAYHQARANGHPADALFRQQQALLRTLPTPSTVMADALKLWWVWRKKAERPFLRSTLLVILALLFTIATIAASIFSSLVVDNGTIDVLVKSPLCGRINSTGTAWRSYSINFDRSATSYAASCYKNSSLPPSCSVFMRPNIPLTVQDAPCPFLNTTWCDTKEAVSVDSGLLDVGKTFGLNLAAKDRVQYRKKTTCTVLPIKGAYDVIDLKNLPSFRKLGRPALPNEQAVVLYYGPTFGIIPKASYIASLTMSNISGRPAVFGGRTFYGDPKYPTMPGWFPKDGIEVKKGTGDIFWKPVMSNTVAYNHPVDDPLYAAHKKVQIYDDTQSVNNTRYTADDPIKGVSCLQQFEICHARSGKDDFCTPLQYRPFFDLRPTDFPEANDMQRAVLQQLVFSTWIKDTADITTSKASKRMGNTEATIDSLPDDFWKQEVIAWEQETWAGFQIAISQYAIGPKASDELADRYWLKPETEAEKSLCSAMKMKKSGEFANINLFGLVFILTFSLVAMLVDITLLKFLVYLSRFRRHLGPRIERWIQDGVWQLQRRAYEGEGERDWTNLEGEIPLLKDKAHMLKDLPILWVPGKSPMAMQTRTFESTGSQETLRPAGDNVAADQRDMKSESRWYMFRRR